MPPMESHIRRSGGGSFALQIVARCEALFAEALEASDGLGESLDPAFLVLIACEQNLPDQPHQVVRDGLDCFGISAPGPKAAKCGLKPAIAGLHHGLCALTDDAAQRVVALGATAAVVIAGTLVTGRGRLRPRSRVGLRWGRLWRKG